MADTTNTDTLAASGAASQPEALRLAAIVNSDGYITNIERRQIGAELRRLHALTTAAPAAPAVASGAASLGPLNDRAIKDAIRNAYDLGYRDGAHAGASAAHQVEQDHGGALIHALYRALAAPAAQEAEPVGYWVSFTDEPELELGHWFSEEPCGEGYLSLPLYAHPPRPQADAGAPPAVKVTQDMRRVFREAYRVGGFWADRLDYALERMLAAAPRPQADGGAPDAPEGCTPADARMLRKANHALAAESFELQTALRGIVAQAGGALARFDIAAAPQAPAAPDMESVLIDGVAYQTPAPVAAELLRLHLEAMEAPAAGAAPSQHITQPYTVAEIRERVASGDYSAELMLQHALLHLGAGAAPTDAEIDDLCREISDYDDPKYFRHMVRAVLARWGAAAPAQEAAPLTQAELQEVRRAVDDIEDCGETDVDYDLLLRAAMAGYLECTRFQVLDQSALDRAAARARQEGQA